MLRGKDRPPYTHRVGDEWFYVIKGEFVYEVGGKLHRVVEGGSLVAPQKFPHRYINGPLPGTLFVGLTPGGRLEELKRVPDDAETHLPRLLAARSWSRRMRSITWTT
jgi:mannose-6-phosphate isomerase-like protein (cupin superfamily)